MSVLRSLEQKIAGLVEGAFGRAFRSEVRPVEIARKLAREMEEHQAPSLSRTYVPNDYAVYLSLPDYDRLTAYEEALTQELAGYLLEHARRERFALLSRPNITFRVDEQLGLGQFGIAAGAVRPPQSDRAAAPAGDQQPAGAGEELAPPAGGTMVHSSARPLRAPPARPTPPPGESARLVLEGRRVRVGPGGAVIGRSRDCDVVLDDANASRRHAEVHRRGGDWAVADLGSTNGVRVNGRMVAGEQLLRSGDLIVVGTSELRFDQG